MDYIKDLKNCLTVQPKRIHPPVSIKAQQLAEELLDLLDGNSARAKAIIREIVFYSPNKSIEWYYERAIDKLSKNKTVNIVSNK